MVSLQIFLALVSHEVVADLAHGSNTSHITFYIYSIQSLESQYIQRYCTIPILK